MEHFLQLEFHERFAMLKNVFVSASFFFIFPFSHFAFSQQFVSGRNTITIAGHKSPACNPKSGDDRNMDWCRLRVLVAGPVRKSLLLPGELASVQEVRSPSPDTLLFLGSFLYGDAVVLSAQSLGPSPTSLKLLASKVSLSPDAKQVVSQRYVPPHGGELPTVELLETVIDEKQLDASASIALFSSRATHMDGSDGSVLCSTNIFWSADGRTISACIESLPDRSLHFIILNRRDGRWTAIERNIPSESLCDGPVGKKFACSILVQQLNFKGGGITAVATIEGWNGITQKYIVIKKNQLTPLEP